MGTIIALVGQRNVGKTTIYNQLSKNKFKTNKYNIINTIDRKHTEVTIFSTTFEIIDTPAFIIKPNEIQKKSLNQTLIAIQQSDIILFIINAKKGITLEDKKIAKKIHQKKDVFLLMNKIDNLSNETLESINFNQLGFKKISYVSALNKSSILMFFYKKIIPLIKKTNLNKTTIPNKNNSKTHITYQNKTKITIIGKPNVGKSTLTNNLINEQRTVTDNSPGTTKDSIHIPIKIFNQPNFELIDTAGARKKNKINHNSSEKNAISQTLYNIKHSDLILLLVEPRDCICSQNIHLLNYAIKQGCSIIVIVNKCDTLSFSDKKIIQKKVLFYSNIIKTIKIHFISALLKKGTCSLFFSINQVLKSTYNKILTSKLTKILQILTKKCPPPLIHRTRIKLKFAHLIQKKPLKILIYGNQTKKIPKNYKKYLTNGFIKNLKLISTPILISYKDNINPYIRTK